MKQTFEFICQVCREARELARKIGFKAAAMYARAHNIALDLALGCLIRKPITM